MKPPTLLRSDNMHPSFAQVSLFIVWIRYTIMTAEILNAIDAYPVDTEGQDIQRQVDRFCVGIEDLICEWSLCSTMMDESKTEFLRYLVADHVSAKRHPISMHVDSILTV